VSAPESALVEQSAAATVALTANPTQLSPLTDAAPAVQKQTTTETVVLLAVSAPESALVEQSAAATVALTVNPALLSPLTDAAPPAVQKQKASDAAGAQAAPPRTDVTPLTRRADQAFLSRAVSLASENTDFCDTPYFPTRVSWVNGNATVSVNGAVLVSQELGAAVKGHSGLHCQVLSIVAGMIGFDKTTATSSQTNDLHARATAAIRGAAAEMANYKNFFKVTGVTSPKNRGGLQRPRAELDEEEQRNDLFFAESFGPRIAALGNDFARNGNGDNTWTVALALHLKIRVAVILFSATGELHAVDTNPLNLPTAPIYVLLKGQDTRPNYGDIGSEQGGHYNSFVVRAASPAAPAASATLPASPTVSSEGSDYVAESTPTSESGGTLYQSVSVSVTPCSERTPTKPAWESPQADWEAAAGTSSTANMFSLMQARLVAPEVDGQTDTPAARKPTDEEDRAAAIEAVRTQLEESLEALRTPSVSREERTAYKLLSTKNGGKGKTGDALKNFQRRLADAETLLPSPKKMEAVGLAILDEINLAAKCASLEAQLCALEGGPLRAARSKSAGSAVIEQGDSSQPPPQATPLTRRVSGRLAALHEPATLPAAVAASQATIAPTVSGPAQAAVARRRSSTSGPPRYGNK
jgi:hypothetical protein